MNTNKESAILFFESLIQNYYQFNVSVGINIQKDIDVENVVIYSDKSNNTINITSKETYEFNLHHLNYDSNMPIIYEFNDGKLLKSVNYINYLQFINDIIAMIKLDRTIYKSKLKKYIRMK